MRRFFKSLPPSVVVLGGAGLVGGISAVIAVVLYQDVTRGDSPVTVPSKTTDNDR